MNASLRLAWMAVLCGASTGCAILPLAAVNLATAGAQGVVALTLGPMDAMKERSVADRCLVYADKGIAVSESLETVIPFDEGEIKTFEPAFWRPEFSRDGYPDVERTRNSTEVTLAIGARSAFLVPPPGAIRTRIPYELVQDVELRTNASAGEPSALIVTIVQWALRYRHLLAEVAGPKESGRDRRRSGAAQGTRDRVSRIRGQVVRMATRRTESMNDVLAMCHDYPELSSPRARA